MFLRFLPWCLLAGGLIAALLLLRPTTSLRPMLPDDPLVLRSAEFFEQRAAAQMLALDCRGGDEQQRYELLQQLSSALQPLGVQPAAAITQAQIAQTAEVVHQHLPVLLTADALAALPQTWEHDALVTRLTGIREHLLTADAGFSAPALYRDPLGLGGRFLQHLQQGGHIQAGVVTHPEQAASLLLLRVPFPASASSQTTALLTVIDAFSATMPADVSIRTIGPYRHFHENEQRAYGALFTTLPVSIILIVLVLTTLLRSFRAICSLHLPAIVGAIAAFIGMTLMMLGNLPVILLAFLSGIIGIAIDYGIHMARACRGPGAHTVFRPLAISACTSAAAFLVLLLSSTPALRALAVGMACGIAGAWLAARDLIPVLTPPAPRPSHGGWSRVGSLLDRVAVRLGMWRWLLLAFLTLAALPGLQSLHISQNMQDLDGSRATTKQALVEFEGLWGRLTGSEFIVSEGPELDAALTHVQRASAQFDRYGPLARLLPDRATQQQRAERWNAFWLQHAADWQQALERACAAVGIRVAAFAPAQISYAPRSAPTQLTVEAWNDTAVEQLLADQISTNNSVWTVIDPLWVNSGEEGMALAQQLRGEQVEAAVWIASRRLLGATLVDAIFSDLVRLSLVMIVGMALVLLVLLRSVLAVIEVFVPALLALLWTLGLMGWLGIVLLPFHILIATFVLGIGIDDALFLRENGDRRIPLQAVLATTLTTCIGIGSLALSEHPVQSSAGAAVAVGMFACLIAVLLVVYRKRPQLPSDETT